MPHAHFSLTQKSLIYAVKTLLGATICWYGLSWVSGVNPLWAIISVIIVSDTDFSGTMTLAKTRVLNTIVGCVSAMCSLILFGYGPWVCFLTAAATVLFITSIDFYPTNWRLAPVTVVIVMDAARHVADKKTGIFYGLIRTGEIIGGCAVALCLAYLFSYVLRIKKKIPADQAQDHQATLTHDPD
jgi:uncharacterized membrane protein YccC